MKKSVSIIILLVAIILAFSIGYLSRQPVPTENIERIDINDIIGTDQAAEKIEFFDYNWGEDQGSYGTVKEYLGGGDRECYLQAERQIVQTKIRENLVQCTVNEITISEGILEIGCACLFD